ncbi:unnamed protein product, partial [Coccothraustes coccothraustes]
PAGLGHCQGTSGTPAGHRQSSQGLSTGRGCGMSQRGLCHSSTSVAVSERPRAAVMAKKGCEQSDSCQGTLCCCPLKPSVLTVEGALAQALALGETGTLPGGPCPPVPPPRASAPHPRVRLWGRSRGTSSGGGCSARGGGTWECKGPRPEPQPLARQILSLLPCSGLFPGWALACGDVQWKGQDHGAAPARLLSRDKEAMRPQACQGHLSPCGLRPRASSHGQSAAHVGSVRALQLLPMPVPCAAQAVLRCPCSGLCPCRLCSSPGCPTWLSPSFADSSASCLPLPAHTKPWP